MFTVVVFLAHKISYSFSPLIKSTVESELKAESKSPDEIFLSELERYKVEGSFWQYLTRPIELLNLIKRYHDIGNLFFVVAFAQIMSLAYLGFKSIFHAMVIGQDKQKANHYASSWFPRILESYPNPENFYALLIIICTYYFLLRLLCLRRLVLGSIINKQGYRRLTITQTNLPCAGAYNLPGKAWIDLIKLTLTHRRLCNNNQGIKEKHLAFDKSCKDKLMRCSKKELIYYTNVIDFNSCFGEFMEEMAHDHRSKWAANWHIAQPSCYLDPHELGILILLQISGLSLLFGLISVLIILHLFYEVSRLTPDPDEATYADILKTIPCFMTNLNAIIKFSDVTLNMLVQIPNHIEAAIIYLDMVILISRTRKVSDALKADLDLCETRAYSCSNINKKSQLVPEYRSYTSTESNPNQDSLRNNHTRHGSGHMSISERKTLNESIELHVILAQMVNLEFIDLKRSHTLYLNLLFVGCGFCISVCISLIFVVKSNLVIYILISLVISCSVPLIGAVLFCVTSELTVSR